MKRRLAAFARLWLLALALLASGGPLLAQERRDPGSGETGAERGPRIERRQPRRDQAPPELLRSLEGLQPFERRALRRHIQRMPEWRRQELYQRWNQLDESERAEALTELRGRAERRAARQLPPRLRTPEMRERLERMSPEERDRFFERVHKWRQMSRADRQRMRGRLEAFGALDAEAQRKLVDEKFRAKGEEERARILQSLREASGQLGERGKKRGTAGGAPQNEPAPSSKPPPPGEGQSAFEP